MTWSPATVCRARVLRFVVVGLASLAAGIGPDRNALGAEPGISDAAALYQSLRSPGVDPAQAFTITPVTLTRGASRLSLESGTVFPIVAGDAGVIGVVFQGSGRFAFAPPDAKEADQLEKFAKKRALDEQFTRMLLLFTDATLAELRAAYASATSDTGTSAEAHLKARLSRYVEKLRANPAARLLADRVEDVPASRGLFQADIDTTTLGTLLFSIDPADEPPETLAQYVDRSGGTVETWCAFGASAGPRAVVSGYDIEVKLSGTRLIGETVTATLDARAEGVRVLNFHLSPLMALLSVTAGDNSPLFFAREKRDNKSWAGGAVVVLPVPLRDGDTVGFTLQGDIIEGTGIGSGQYGILAAASWYPTLGYLERSTFKFRFDTDAKQTVFVSAKKLSDEVRDGRRITTWEQSFPVILVSFNYGTMSVKEVKLKGRIPVAVFGSDSVVELGDQRQNVGIDVSNSLSLFSWAFGDYPFDWIYATSIPYRHGQGFPGLLHLSSRTFAKERRGASEAFRAHEVAHQWWGHLVGWKSYRDQWMSEGFAEYSSALYVLFYTKDADLFRDMLAEWRKDLIHPDGGLGAAAGPLTLGVRLITEKSGDDYRRIVYGKGAWVLHMLRMMLRDFKTGTDERFLAAMRDFVATFRGKNVDTADFRRVMEKHAGEDLGWFFDAWVDGSVIPRYEYGWKPVAAAGTHKVELRIRQKNALPFKMIVPVKFDFAGGQSAIARIVIDQADKLYQLDVPAPVQNVELNPFDAVLCEVTREKQ